MHVAIVLATCMQERTIIEAIAIYGIDSGELRGGHADNRIYKPYVYLLGGYMNCFLNSLRK